MTKSYATNIFFFFLDFLKSTDLAKVYLNTFKKEMVAWHLDTDQNHNIQKAQIRYNEWETSLKNIHIHIFHIYILLNYFAIHLKITQHCKSPILLLKKKNYQTSFWKVKAKVSFMGMTEVGQRSGSGHIPTGGKTKLLTDHGTDLPGHERLHGVVV